MRCDNPQTRYESCPKRKRLSIFIPLNAVKPDGICTALVFYFSTLISLHTQVFSNFAVNYFADSGYRKELFRFTCFNSCVGGMNRRPTHLSFRLECGYVI